MTTLVWFRKDLRIHDNPALLHATLTQKPIIAVYIIDPEEPRPMGEAARLWTHEALKDLQYSLKNLRIPLYFFQQSPLSVLQIIHHKLSLSHVFWNRLYTNYEHSRDATIESYFQSQNVHVESSHGYLLFEPWAIKNQKDSPFKVFTPFWKKCLQSPRTPSYLNKLSFTNAPIKHESFSQNIDDLNLYPQSSAWAKKIIRHWDISENGALKCLHSFIKEGLNSYDSQRDIPCLKNGTSKLSPYLHHGQISIHRIWDEIEPLKNVPTSSKTKFLNELGWREFCYHLLFHFPHITTQNFNPQFHKFKWIYDEDLFHKWTKGCTGIPIIDAGMKQLWQTGWMHNRVRMIVASFLTKHLFMDWRHGEKWFWNTLVDADPANNVAGWQWIAGCGADAAPYFRIFNPILQAEKFDPQGYYVRTFIPELKNIDNANVHQPWKTHNSQFLEPIVNLKWARERALTAYKISLENKETEKY